MDEDPVIEVRDLVRKFGNRTVLNGISFTVNKGDTLIIMAPPGAIPNRFQPLLPES